MKMLNVTEDIAECTRLLLTLDPEGAASKALSEIIEVVSLGLQRFEREGDRTVSVDCDALEELKEAASIGLCHIKAELRGSVYPYVSLVETEAHGMRVEEALRNIDCNDDCDRCEDVLARMREQGWHERDLQALNSVIRQVRGLDEVVV